MRIFILLALVWFCSCSKTTQHSNPRPKVGEQLSHDYENTLLREETPEYVKWLVITGGCIDCYYYVTCDHSGKILSVWHQ